MIHVIGLYTLYSISFIFIKQTLAFSRPIFLTGVRMLLAGVCSYGLHTFWYKRISYKDISWIAVWYIILLAFFNVYLTNANEAWSLQYLSAGKVAFIYNLSPFFSLFFSAWMFSEKITLKKIIGMVIACASISPLLIDSTSQEQVVDVSGKLFGSLSIAEMVMIIAAAATAFGWVIMKYLMKMQPRFDTYFLNGVSLMIGGLFCLIQSWFFEPTPYVQSNLYFDFISYTMLTMMLQNVIAYNFNAYLLKRYSATLIILFSFIMPVITALLGYFLLNEPLTYLFFICSSGVGLGLLIFYQEELAHEKLRL